MPFSDYCPILYCECGYLAGAKTISPLTNKPVCKPCRKLHYKGIRTVGKNADEVARGIQAISENDKKKQRERAREKAKAKRERRKAGIINPCGSHAFDTPQFRSKQKTLPSRQKKLREKPTQAELHIKSLLDRNSEIKYIFQKGFIAYGYYCIVDFYMPFFRLCLEIDGGYHLFPDQQEKDERRDVYLKEVRRFKVLRLTNEQALAINTPEELEALCFKHGDPQWNYYHPPV